MEIRPYHGRHWKKKAKADRLPATYSRLQGVGHLLAFYDLYEDTMFGYIRKRKRWKEFLDVLQLMRRKYPSGERIYLILDNFSPHRRKEIRKWAKNNMVKLIWTPTNASWLNRIECQFTEIRKFVFDNSNYKSHCEVNLALRKFITYRNKRNLKRKLIKLKRQ